MLQKQLTTPPKGQDEVANVDSKTSAIQNAKEDALVLAKLLYDIYKSEQISARVISGQNNEKVS